MNIENEIYNILSVLENRLSDISLFTSRDYLSRNEFGLAFDCLVDNIDEEGVSLSEIELIKLKEIYEFLGNKERYPNLDFLSHNN